MWRRCSQHSRTSPPAIRLLQAHRNPCDLAHYLDFLGMKIRFRVAVRCRMRLHDKLPLFERAPPTGVAPTVFEEIDGALEFIRPAGSRDFVYGVVNHYYRSRRN